jgi:AcrR family transcriptional regulator
MPLPRYARLEPERRARLLEAATAEFAARGFADASLNEILAAAGLGKSSYYYYFADKEDLFATVLDEVYRSIAAEVPALDLDVRSAKHFWAAVAQHLLGWLQAISQKPLALRLIRDAQAIRRKPTPALAFAFQRLSSMTRTIIEEGRRRGFVRTDLEVSVLVALVEGADAALDASLYEQTANPSPARLLAHAQLALDTCRRLLTPRPP